MSYQTDGLLLLGGCFNGEAIDEWSFNGPGTNPYPLVPAAVDYFAPARPLILNDMLSLFDNACPDLVIPAEPDTLVIPAEIEELVIL